MKKITAILFLSIYLLYSTGAHELLKLNALVDHFYESQENDRALTFSQFLLMHYVTDDLNDRDDERDKQLPFRSAESYAATSTGFYIPVYSIQASCIPSFIITEPFKIIPKDLFIDTDFKSFVWHPPRC